MLLINTIGSKGSLDASATFGGGLGLFILIDWHFGPYLPIFIAAQLC